MPEGSSYRIGIVTGHRAPELSEDGKRVAASLEDRGFEVEPVMWDDPSVDWDGYDASVVRSSWDYPDDVDRFRALLDEMERAGTIVCNPLDAIRWNLHKSYVEDLADAGIPLPDTTVVQGESKADLSDADLSAVMDRVGVEEAVVKPAIGTSSRDVWRVERSSDRSLDATGADDPHERFESMLDDGDVIVQSYVPEIEGGERSVVFFDGEFSHAWNSLTAEDDVTDFADHDADYDPDPRIVSQAEAVLRVARGIVGRDRPFPYARVDYVEPGGELLLLELELIEPYLGLDRGEDTVDNFAAAIAERIRRETSAE